MDSTPFMLVKALFSLILAGVVAFGLYRVIAPRAIAKTAVYYGRYWCAWIVLLSTLSMLPRFFLQKDAESIIRWVVVCVFYGAAAFGVGWFYGKMFRAEEKNSNDDEFRSGINPSRILQDDPVGGMKKSSLGGSITEELEAIQENSRVSLGSAMGMAKKRLAEEKIYEAVVLELEKGIRREGLWAKALVASGGDNNTTIAKYIEFRVEAIKDEVLLSDELVSDGVHSNQKNIEIERDARSLNDTEPLSDAQKGTLVFLFFVAAAILTAVIIFLGVNNRFS